MDFLELLLRGNDSLHYLGMFYELGLKTNFAIRKMVGQNLGHILITQRLWKITMDYLESLGAITRASLVQTRVELSMKQLFQAVDNVEAPRQIWGFLNLAKGEVTDEELGQFVRKLGSFSYYSAEALVSYTVKRMAQIRDGHGDMHAFFRAIMQDTVSYQNLSPRALAAPLQE